MTQWDYGQVLQICGMQIQEKQIQVHFSNRCTEQAWIVLGTVEDGDIFVEIPNELLKKNGIINAYVYQTIPGEGRTTFEVRLGVKARKKPQDYEAPDDKHALEQVLEQTSIKRGQADIWKKPDAAFSGENLLSEVELPEGGGSETVEIESITNPEIDEIMKGAE